MTWLWGLLAVPYLFIAGYIYGYLHNRPGHDQAACGQDKPPCAISAALWPVPLAGLLIRGIILLGARTEARRPSRRIRERDKRDLRDLDDPRSW